MSHPPDAILHAYAALVDHVFVYLRNSAGRDPRLISDLADAMHNVGQLLASYGAWCDDEAFRQLNLRPFDRTWGTDGPHLEALLDGWLASHGAPSPPVAIAKAAPELTLLVLRCPDVDASKRFFEAIGLSWAPEKHGSGPSHWSCTLGEVVLELYS